MVKRQTQIITLSLLVGGWMLAADNPYNGSWKIDAPKSSWSNGRFPKNMSIVITLTFTGDELKYHSINDTNKAKASHTLPAPVGPLDRPSTRNFTPYWVPTEPATAATTDEKMTTCDASLRLM